MSKSKRVKARLKQKHEETYGRPMCHLCEECYLDKSKQHRGFVTHYCKLTGRDVGQSHFGMNSPRSCPKRKGEDHD